MTILELKKMMMKAKKEDKTKANALMMLVDSAQKIAKDLEEIDYVANCLPEDKVEEITKLKEEYKKLENEN